MRLCKRTLLKGRHALTMALLLIIFGDAGAGVRPVEKTRSGAPFE